MYTQSHKESKSQLEMDNPETLTTLGTQETGRTMIDITLHRNPTLQFR
jgi:hypothetical protein